MQPMELTSTFVLQAGVRQMRHTDYRTLIDRGRKAGLKTTDLYNALAGRRAQAGDRNWHETDGNGFVSAVDSQGQNIFQPLESR
jgi:hypothetical protein